MQPTSMPSVQMPIVAQDQQQPPIRTPYAPYVQNTSASSHLSLPTTAAESSLAIPRYVDTNPRPTKSPRHASHQSIGSSISNDTTSGEYRYGPPPTQGTGSVYAPSGPAPTGTGPDVLSPHSQQHPHLPPPTGTAHSHPQAGGAPGTTSSYPPPPQDSGASTGTTGTSAPSTQTTAPQPPPPPRDYFPPSQSWTTTAGEAPPSTYANGPAAPAGSTTATGSSTAPSVGSATGAGNGSANASTGGATGAPGADRPYAFPASAGGPATAAGPHVKDPAATAAVSGYAGVTGYTWSAA